MQTRQAGARRVPAALASLLLLLVAYAVRLDSPLVWLGPIAFVGYVNRFQIGPEERALKAKFGEAYLRYRSHTRRWL